MPDRLWRWGGVLQSSGRQLVSRLQLRVTVKPFLINK